MSSVTILGSGEPCGAYLLRIGIARDIEVSFGRFHDGQAIPVKRGDVLYIGSAMARSGSTTLARRTLRHATRSASRPPQGLLPELTAALVASAMAPAGLHGPLRKKLHWHVDFLLDDESAILQHAYLLRTGQRLENELAEMLLADPASSIISPGLGARDHRGSTHLVRISAGESWWRDLPARLNLLLQENATIPGHR